MTDAEKSRSFKYRIIGAATIMLLLVITLPIIFHNSEKDKVEEFQRIEKATLDNQDDKFISTIERMDDENVEKQYQVDELSMGDEILPTANTDDQLQDIKASDDVFIEDIDPDVAAMNSLDDSTSNSPDVNAAALAEKAAQDAAQAKQIEADKVAAAEQEKTNQAQKDPLDKLIEEHSNSANDFAPQNIAVGWVVQVGTFSEAKNAQAMIDKLTNNGFQPQFKVIETEGAKATRVWVGPYEKRVVASKAMDKVASVTSITPFIRSYP